MEEQQFNTLVQQIEDVRSETSWVENHTQNLDGKLDKIIELLESIEYKINK